MALGLKGDPADDAVQQEVTDEDDHIIEHDRVRGGVQEHVHHALGLAQVDHDEEAAHDHGRNGHELAEDDHDLEFLVVMEIGGQNQHNGGSGHTDEVGELGNIETPGHIPAHAGHAETVKQLVDIDAEARCNESH